MISLFQNFLPLEMLIDTIKGKAGQDWKWLPKNKETIGRGVEKGFEIVAPFIWFCWREEEEE